MPEARTVISQALQERQRYGLPASPWTEHAERIIFEAGYRASVIELQMVQAKADD